MTYGEEDATQRRQETLESLHDRRDKLYHQLKKSFLLLLEKCFVIVSLPLTLEKKSIKTRHSPRLALHSARCRRPSHFTKYVSSLVLKDFTFRTNTIVAN